MPSPFIPFSDFLDGRPEDSPLRDAVTQHYLASETECVERLLRDASHSPALVQQAQTQAAHLVTALRGKRRKGPMRQLVGEYDLSSQEGVALMCLAEALLRIPDSATRDALIRDKIVGGNWAAHLGGGRSVFVNAAGWGLALTGKLMAPGDTTDLGTALTRLVRRGGEAVIRRGIDVAIRAMGGQFVAGRTIEEALGRAEATERRGYRHSYDMLGEAAMTAADAARYARDYETAIHAIGSAARGANPYERPGISIKLSALHPRYQRSQRSRVMSELYPTVERLAGLARHYNIGLNIDAEESERLDLSLDILKLLCESEGLAGWDGIGFVVQAYQKRAPFVLDWMIDLARRTRRRLMVRLVKGAYWDSEIKRAQVEGLTDFPVYTRKVHTDLSYLACAKKLLDARDAVFPQFATHNAYCVAMINVLAGDLFTVGDYEFQCLHGMGEPLYDDIVGSGPTARPCRIYAPVGSHETLLAYLVRRLLENGANSSFVNQVQDPSVPVGDLVADPAAIIRRQHPVGLPNPKIAFPAGIFLPDRQNARGLNLADESVLDRVSQDLRVCAERRYEAAPDGSAAAANAGHDIMNPAHRSDRIGTVVEAGAEDIEATLSACTAHASVWADIQPAQRAEILSRASDLMENRSTSLIALLVREAGKTLANAVGEVREAVDFLRYYAARIRTEFVNETHRPLGVVVCISPWNFPLAIFVGQVGAALAAGNGVIAKPAEETPLIAAQAIALLKEAGVPEAVLGFLPGGGSVGAALVGDARVHGVLFTGSTEVARTIQKSLSGRLNPDGSPVTLIAETGGQNAMIVDSSALAEQVVADVVASSFDSAGQRCSALRILCVQDDVADSIIAMLKGAMEELAIGFPDRLSTDIGPVITAEARDTILAHVERMRARGCDVFQVGLPDISVNGFFVPPTLIEIGRISDLGREVFGPVLHVRRYAREERDAVLAAITSTGYGLTFGLHTRVDATVRSVIDRASAGNIYINRNIIGAVVGSQPFGGHGLSGTGPKAGGPLYLLRLLAEGPSPSPLMGERVMLGPVGEENRYRITGRGTGLCIAESSADRTAQLQACGRTGNNALTEDDIRSLEGGIDAAAFNFVLFAGADENLKTLLSHMAARPGPIVPIFLCSVERPVMDAALCGEWTISTNTAAAGGNVQLMTLG